METEIERLQIYLARLRKRIRTHKWRIQQLKQQETKTLYELRKLLGQRDKESKK